MTLVFFIEKKNSKKQIVQNYIYLNKQYTDQEGE